MKFKQYNKKPSFNKLPKRKKGEMLSKDISALSLFERQFVLSSRDHSKELIEQRKNVVYEPIKSTDVIKTVKHSNLKTEEPVVIKYEEPDYEPVVKPEIIVPLINREVKKNRFSQFRKKPSFYKLPNNKKGEMLTKHISSMKLVDKNFSLPKMRHVQDQIDLQPVIKKEKTKRKPKVVSEEVATKIVTTTTTTTVETITTNVETPKTPKATKHSEKTTTISKLDSKSRIKTKGREVLVEIRDMDITFGKKQNVVHAVKGLNLNVYKGEVLGIVGESGSGKSTTGNAILGLVNRTNGTLKIKGKEVPARVKDIKGDIHDFMVKTVQMIFQDPASSLNPYKNIYKIVSEGLKNVDVKQIYAKTFDGITATTLSDLLKDKKQPKSLAKISLQWINEKIEEDEFDLVVDALYGKAIDDLYAMDVPYAVEAATYLRMRKNIRDEFTDSADSRSKIEEKLVIDILESVGLSEDMLQRYPLEFSGGQQQRVGISRAVVLKPELIVADEPISALDVSIQAQVVNIFNELKRKLNLTIVFIAHDLRMVEYISDRIAVMYKGELLEIGTASEIVNNPIHPYTKSLIDSIPTIDKINESLRSKRYDPSQHKYDGKNKPSWLSVSHSKDVVHQVFGTKEEVQKWIRGDYE